MASGARDLGVTFSSQLLCLGLSIGTQSCLAWFLGPEGRGAYAVCLVFATVLSVVFVVGCDAASIYFVSSKKFTLSEGIIYTTIYGGIGSLLAVVVGLILMQFDFSFFEKASQVSFYISLGLIPSLLFSLIFVKLFTSIHQFNSYAVMSVLNVILILFFTIAFVWGFGWGVNGALFGNLAGSTMITLICLFVFWRKYDAGLVRPSIRRLVDMFHYGVRYHLGKISNLMNAQMGTILIALFASPADVGIFAVAMSATSRILILPDSITTTLMPRIPASAIDKSRLVAQCARLSALLCGLLLLLLALFTKPIVLVLFSKAFLPAVTAIRVLCIGMFIRGTSKIFVPYLLGTNHPGIASVSVLVGMAVNILSLLILLPLMGITGAALSVVLNYFVSSAILLFGFNFYSGLRLFEICRYQRADFKLLAETIRKVHKKIMPFSSDTGVNITGND